MSILASFIINILFQIASSKLDCNGIEMYVDEELIIYPVGVCMNGGEQNAAENWTKLECSSDGSDIFRLSYQDILCSGNPISNQSVTEMMQSSNITNFTMECCANSCEWGIRRMYHVDDCNETISNNTDLSGLLLGDLMPFYVGQCIQINDQTSIEFNECLDAQKMVFLQYLHSTDCTGKSTTMTNDTFNDGFCEEMDFNSTNSTNSTQSDYKLINVHCIMSEPQTVSSCSSQSTLNPIKTTFGSTYSTNLNGTDRPSSTLKLSAIINNFIVFYFLFVISS